MYKMNPFLPLTRLASFNRFNIVALPGIAMPPDIEGKTGYAVVSSEALLSLCREHAAAFGLEAGRLNLERLPLLLNQPVHHLAAQHAIQQIGDTLGKRFGYLLILVKKGGTLNRAARPEWNDSHWAYWHSIRQVWIGGGLMLGSLGDALLKAAQDMLHSAGIADLILQKTSFGANLGLVGLTRLAPPTISRALVIDCGGTHIKRGIAEYQKGQVRALRLLSPLPSSSKATSALTPQEASVFLEDLGLLIAETYQQAAPVEWIGCSMACYLHNGHPAAPAPFGYDALGLVTTHLETSLSRIIASHTPFTLFHDGSAAALVYAGIEKAAVFTLGTAIGLGFPPSSDGLRQFTGNFTLVQHQPDAV